jgi:hypothetical protein
MRKKKKVMREWKRKKMTMEPNCLYEKDAPLMEIF